MRICGVGESHVSQTITSDDRRQTTHRSAQSRISRMTARAASILLALRRRQLALFLLGCTMGFAAANVLGRARVKVGSHGIDAPDFVLTARIVRSCCTYSRALPLTAADVTSACLVLQPVATVVVSSSVDDDPFLGSQESFEEPGRLSSCARSPPAHRGVPPAVTSACAPSLLGGADAPTQLIHRPICSYCRYIYKQSETVEMYDKTWTEGTYPRKARTPTAQYPPRDHQFTPHPVASPVFPSRTRALTMHSAMPPRAPRAAGAAALHPPSYNGSSSTLCLTPGAATASSCGCCGSTGRTRLGWSCRGRSWSRRARTCSGRASWCARGPVERDKLTTTTIIGLPLHASTSSMPSQPLTRPSAMRRSKGTCRTYRSRTMRSTSCSALTSWSISCPARRMRW